MWKKIRHLPQCICGAVDQWYFHGEDATHFEITEEYHCTECLRPARMLRVGVYDVFFEPRLLLEYMPADAVGFISQTLLPQMHKNMQKLRRMRAAFERGHYVHVCRGYGVDPTEGRSGLPEQLREKFDSDIARAFIDDRWWIPINFRAMFPKFPRVLRAHIHSELQFQGAAVPAWHRCS